MPDEKRIEGEGFLNKNRGSLSIVGVASLWMPPHYCVLGHFDVLDEKSYFWHTKKNLCASLLLMM